MSLYCNLQNNCNDKRISKNSFVRRLQFDVHISEVWYTLIIVAKQWSWIGLSMIYFGPSQYKYTFIIISKKNLSLSLISFSSVMSSKRRMVPITTVLIKDALHLQRQYRLSKSEIFEEYRLMQTGIRKTFLFRLTPFRKFRQLLDESDWRPIKCDKHVLLFSAVLFWVGKWG